MRSSSRACTARCRSTGHSRSREGVLKPGRAPLVTKASPRSASEPMCCTMQWLLRSRAPRFPTSVTKVLPRGVS
eukprot:13097433-Alexandrium_andersonii.AAC.1